MPDTLSAPPVMVLEIGRKRLVLAALGILAAMAIAVVLAANRGDDPRSKRLSALGDLCQSGDYRACDELFLVAETGSKEARYGSTCGDRTHPHAGTCEKDLGADLIEGHLENLNENCDGGDMASCDQLYAEAKERSYDWKYGATCGERTFEHPGRCADDLGKQLTTDVYLVRDECARGLMPACDFLYDSGRTDDDSQFGSTCGGRSYEHEGKCAKDPKMEPPTTSLQ